MVSYVRYAAVIWGAASIIGCSATEFGSAKNDTLAKSSVFGGDATGQIKQPGQGRDDDDARGQLNQDGSIADVAGMLTQLPGVDEVPVQLVCSDSRSERASNLKGAMVRNETATLKINGQACTTDKQKILAMGIAGKITAAELAGLCPAALANGKIKFAEIIMPAQKLPGLDFGMRGKALEILYALNQDEEPANEAADANCDRRSSPLVIHHASDINNPIPIALSSQEDGNDFDLLGANNDYETVRISWFTNTDYSLLALPNPYGSVDGIDELFGDNTQGPDGEFAENGYAALAKYDGTTTDGIFQIRAADGRIDNRDPVFYRLRLWTDTNLDGRAQEEELTSLRRAGITFIDLEYSEDYAERDQYGNETKMKSVVGRSDGSLDLIFDLWFSYRLNEEI